MHRSNMVLAKNGAVCVNYLVGLGGGEGLNEGCDGEVGRWWRGWFEV